MKYLSLLLIILVSCSNPNSYENKIKEIRNQKDITFKSEGYSPLKAEDKSNFIGLNYFQIDEKFKVKAVLQEFSTKPRIVLNTTKSEHREYYEFGTIRFSINKVEQELIVIASKESLISDKKEKEVFIPFFDKSNGEHTYEGGRYLDFTVAPNQVDVLLDFNLAYNPYCAYNEGYSCVVPPTPNYIDVSIEVGEKKFH